MIQLTLKQLKFIETEIIKEMDHLDFELKNYDVVQLPNKTLELIDLCDFRRIIKNIIIENSVEHLKMLEEIDYLGQCKFIHNHLNEDIKNPPKWIQKHLDHLDEKMKDVVPKLEKSLQNTIEVNIPEKYQYIVDKVVK